jgi:hypothetical protein
MTNKLFFGDFTKKKKILVLQCFLSQSLIIILCYVKATSPKFTQLLKLNETFYYNVSHWTYTSSIKFFLKRIEKTHSNFFCLYRRCADKSASRQENYCPFDVITSVYHVIPTSSDILRTSSDVKSSCYSIENVSRQIFPPNRHFRTK